MIKQVFIFFTTFLTMITSFVLCNIHYTGNEQVVLVRSVEGKNSFISYVTIDELPYVVKQKIDCTKKIAFVRDALAAYIAEVLGVANSVQIILANDDIPGRMYTNLPATLHTLAAGKAVSDLGENKYAALSLKQVSFEGDCSSNGGLTESIIYQMTWHIQLPLIIALDLFISNTDRHRGNLFYDEKTDYFCAIDMDNIYRCDLPALACKKLHIMINDNKKKFTKQEIKALTSMRNALQLLIKKHTPDKTIAQFHLFAKQAGYTNREISRSKRIALYERMIVSGYISTGKLVVMLDKIINNFAN